MFFLLGVAVTLLIQTVWPAFHPASLSESGKLVVGSARTKHSVPGSSRHQPWGDFEYTKLPLEEPKEFLPETAEPLAAPRWFFGAHSRKEVVDLFSNSALTKEQKAQLLEPCRWQAVTNGFYVSPPPEVVLEMSQAVRERIYGVLDSYPANSAQCHPFRFRPDGFEEWFADTGLGQGELDVLRKLIYRQGGSLCFCDGAIVQRLFSARDFNRLVKALYGERTFLMKLRLTPETDIDALITYWSHGGKSYAPRPLLESLARLPGGGNIGVAGLLPPFARLRLYTFAKPASDPATASENCFWTAMNFFKEKPDNRFLDGGYVECVLASDYEEMAGAPKFGDLMAVRDASGALLHLCVYLADDVVFTKNGRDSIEPWVLMKVPDMVASYQPKQGGQVKVLRAKPMLTGSTRGAS